MSILDPNAVINALDFLARADASGQNSISNFLSISQFLYKEHDSNLIGLTPSFALIYISVEPAVTQNCVPLLQTKKFFLNESINIKTIRAVCTN